MPSLSNPAASPSGPGKRTPNTVLASTGSVGASNRLSSRRTGAAAVTPRSTANTSVWMRSGGTRNSSRRTDAYVTSQFAAGRAGRFSRRDFLRRNNTRLLPSV